MLCKVFPDANLLAEEMLAQSAVSVSNESGGGALGVSNLFFLLLFSLRRRSNTTTEQQPSGQET
jgi:hypothetical protein